MSRKTELAAITRLIDQMGAEILLQRRVPLPKTARDRLNLRSMVELDVIAWHDSLLGTTGQCEITTDKDYFTWRSDDEVVTHAPIMPTWSDYRLDPPGRIAIIGPSPTYEDVRHMELGWSRNERLLEDKLRKAGLDRGQMTWISACWCWPSAGPKQNRPPTSAEIEQWRHWTMQALDAADVEYVLLHGAHALNLWRGDLPVTKLSGEMGLWGERWFVGAIPHTSAVMRPNGLPQTQWLRDISTFVDRVLEGGGFENFGDKCIVCDHSLYAWDDDGIAYCEDHFKAQYHARQRAQNKARKAPNPHQGRII